MGVLKAGIDGDGGVNEPDLPVDLRAMLADDAFVQALASDGMVRPADADLELARLLLAVRREVESEPCGELVDVDEALAAIRGGRGPLLRRVSTAVRRLLGGAW